MDKNLLRQGDNLDIPKQYVWDETVELGGEASDQG